MTDVATRTYRRSFELQRASGVLDGAVEEAQLARGNHRYSSAYAHLRANPGGKVVELGYGTTTLVPILAALADEFHIIDIVDRSGERDQPANLRLRCANLDNDFPFADGIFDTAIAMMVIEHLYDPFHAFAELARILRPGGTALINLPNVASIRCRLQLLFGHMPLTSTDGWFEAEHWDGGHLHYFTVAEVARLARWAGFNLTALQPVGSFVGLKALRPELLCHEITYTLRKPGG